MTDLTSLAAAADLHSVSEALLAINALLKESGVYVVLLALIAACYRVAMAWVCRQRAPRRRESDAPPPAADNQPSPVLSNGAPPTTNAPPLP